MAKKKMGKEGEAVAGPPPLTRSMHYLLSFLRSKARGEYVYRVDIKQADLAKELNISRQALNIKLRPLIQNGYVRTGRGFIELTEKALEALGYYSKPVYIMVSVEPTKRPEVYSKIREKKIGRVVRVAGDVDLIVEAEASRAADILEFLSRLDGVKSTKTYFVLGEIL